MAMNWLKGLVAPPAQFIQPGQPAQPGWSPPAPGSYGAPTPPVGGPPAWNPPNAAPAGTPAWTAPAAGAGQPAAGADPRVAALEARCAELQHNVESLALVARTLLTMMVDRQMVTMEQFQETKQKLDLLDGKLDGKVAG